VAKIYLGRLELSARLRAAFLTAGYEVETEAPPEDPKPGDLALVKAREGVTSTVRHDVLNAMTTVLGFTELLLRRMDLPEGVDSKLERIREYGDRVKNFMRRDEHDLD